MPVDQELSALATVASLLPTDIIYLVRDPGGVAEADNKAAVSVIDARYASAAQGATADSALQAAAIGVTVQAYDAGLSAITAFGRSLIAAANSAAGRVIMVSAGTGVSNEFALEQLYRSHITLDPSMQVRWRVYPGGTIHGSTYHDGAGLNFFNNTGNINFANQAATGELVFTTNSLVRLTVSAAGESVYTIENASTSGITNIATYAHNSSGTPGAGFGTALRLRGESSTSANQEMGRLTYEWADATHASRASRGKLTAYSVASEVECIRWDATGLVSIRASGAGLAAGLHVPWISGDTLPAAIFGSFSATVNPVQIIAGAAVALSVYNASTTSPALETQSYSTSTNAINQALYINHNTSATPVAGFGTQIRFRLNSSTTDNQIAGNIQYLWVDATHASRKARSLWSVYDTAEREAIRIEADGAAAMVGFYGSAAVAKQAVTGSRGGNAALADLLTKLATLGLITDSTTV